jgi:choline dehydrogenase-like flavoprotein
MGGVYLGGFGETLARFDNFVEIDPGGTVDTFGIPVLRISAKFGDNEFAMMKGHGGDGGRDDRSLRGEVRAVLRAALTRFPAGASTRWASPAWATTRRRPVLTPSARPHDVKNLFVMDGSCFVSIACQNPTLTIMAITVRSTDHLLEEMRKGNV